VERSRVVDAQDQPPAGCHDPRHLGQRDLRPVDPGHHPERDSEPEPAIGEGQVVDVGGGESDPGRLARLVGGAAGQVEHRLEDVGRLDAKLSPRQLDGHQPRAAADLEDRPRVRRVEAVDPGEAQRGSVAMDPGQHVLPCVQIAPERGLGREQGVEVGLAW